MLDAHVVNGQLRFGQLASIVQPRTKPPAGTTVIRGPAPPDGNSSVYSCDTNLSDTA